eukprot:2898966-Pleurochrysis_carterae.AAC.1
MVRWWRPRGKTGQRGRMLLMAMAVAMAMAMAMAVDVGAGDSGDMGLMSATRWLAGGNAVNGVLMSAVVSTDERYGIGWVHGVSEAKVVPFGGSCMFSCGGSYSQKREQCAQGAAQVCCLRWAISFFRGKGKVPCMVCALPENVAGEGSAP